MSIGSIVLLAALYTTASFVQGLTGFAYGLILVPMLSLLFTTPAQAVGSMIIASGARAVLGRRDVALGFTAVSGVVAGAFSTPGPIIVGYLYATDENRMRAKANAQFFYVLITGIIIAAHAVGGGVNRLTLLYSLPFAPFVLVGTKLGAVLSKRLPVATFRTVTDVFLIGMGLYLFLGGFF